ncbi:MAG TPA: O-antigen translocase [Candidatus Sulfotelmatobacter sp.]|nr:O-antigen translocase [Candidatus Sulfotelmatobacter sp.]
MAASSEALAVSSSAAVPATEATEKHSYGEILKSSILVGGSSFLNIGIGIIRTKAMALLLGPGGFGLFGLYGSVADLTQNIAELGVNSSGVRQIAEAVGSADEMRIARTAAILRRTSIVLGSLGAAFLVLFSKQVSKITFGSTKEAVPICLLSLVVLFKIISAGQASLIQGTRHIADLAKMSVLGASFGVCTAIPLVYFLRDRGVVPSLVSVAAVTILTSWWYSRKIAVEKVTVTLADVRKEACALLKLGSVFMASGFMTMGVAYFVRVTVLRVIGFEATGLYQSAWNLGGFYVGIILQAMGADFYPRLTASISDHEEANRLVNEQTFIGLLIALPGVLATLTFAPLVISLFYSAKFGAAVGVLRWICLGAMLQVITWPMGFITVAKGRQGFFFFSEFAWTIVAVSLALFCVTRYGLEGAGIAFFGSYVFHCILTYPIARYLTGFRYSVQNQRVGLAACVVIAIVFCSFYLLPLRWAATLGILFLLGSAGYSVRVLSILVPISRIPAPVRRLVRVGSSALSKPRIR